MIEKDTVSLLRECDAGIKMGIFAIDDVMNFVKSEEFRQKLSDYKHEYIALRDEVQSLLDKHNDNGKSPNPVAQSMSWLKTNIRLGLDGSDANVADIMTDGCNMGVKVLGKFINKYAAADEDSKKAAEKLMELGDRQVRETRVFL